MIEHVVAALKNMHEILIYRPSCDTVLQVLWADQPAQKLRLFLLLVSYRVQQGAVRSLSG